MITMRTKVDWEDGGEMDKEKKSSLVLVMLNQGYTDAVMETAKKAVRWRFRYPRSAYG